VGARTILGLPIGVERTIALDRRLSEAEWEKLVVELREVFQARGKVSSSGSFRQWTNGNLQALLEPVGNAHRLRLTTTRGASLASRRIGAAFVGVGGIMSIAAIANGALRLPGWARLRAHQMEAITTQLALETSPERSDNESYA
jgi:hypothetical protein